MSEQIKTKEYTPEEIEKINKERGEIEKLGEDVSRLVKNNKITDIKKVGYQEYHEKPLAVAYDLAMDEDVDRKILKQSADLKKGALFAGQVDAENSKNKVDSEIYTRNKLADINTTDRYKKARISFMKNESWLEPNEALDKIENGFKQGLTLQEIVKGKFFKETLVEAFKERPASFCCSDGRVRIEGSEYNKVGMAGGGILMFPRIEGESNAAWFSRLKGDQKFEQLVNSLNDLNVKEVLSHEECGAARHVGGQERGDDDGAILAQYIHLRLQELGSDNASEIIYRHLTLDGANNGEDKMRREVHDERMLLVDTTGRFNPDALGLPSNFMVSSFKLGMTNNDVEKELEFEMTDLGNRLNEEIKLLVGVAGKHGFKNKRFTKDKPFYIFVIADKQEHLEALQKCADNIAKNIDSLSIKVDGFVYSK